MFCTQRKIERRICCRKKTHSRIVYCCSRMTVWICETRSQKKAPEDRSSDQPIRARFQKTRNRIVQSDYSGRTYKSDGPIRSFGTEIWSVWRSVRRIWLVRPTCMSCQSNLIGRSDFLSSGNALLLADQMICLLAPSFDFLFRKFIQSFASNNKRYANASSFCEKYAFQSTVARETNKTTVTFVIIYSTRGGVLKLCTMLDDVAR